jgi:hypothetical protein
MERSKTIGRIDGFPEEGWVGELMEEKEIATDES